MLEKQKKQQALKKQKESEQRQKELNQAHRDEFDKAYQEMKINKGGTITFHFTKDIILKNGKTGRVSAGKKVVNLNEYMIGKNKQEFMDTIVAMKEDFGATYFTL